MLPELLSQIPDDVEIGAVTADGACDTRRCHDAIADLGAHAVIPPCRNARPWKPSTAAAIARNEALRASKYPGRRHLAKVERIPPPKPRRDKTYRDISFGNALPVSACIA
ncbi:ISSpo9, transposase [Salipiger mucosus DSM 16094]|uniref:ISSpo9, transposase n=1 Tax=Salipiger mucosus DSM 16094 TaxID=1123237 RepID=S9QFK0_9RHOB|nr:ISSpo9, transposase [Salipiger mucosus DSM 16094]